MIRLRYVKASLIIATALLIAFLNSSSRLSSAVGPLNASDKQISRAGRRASDSTQQSVPAAQGRCSLTTGSWCASYHGQAPVPAKVAPAYAKTCPANCSGVGVCNAMTGQCDCPAGWTGRDCSQVQKRPCSAGGAAYRGPGTQPSGHIGPDGRDLNWTAGDWSASRCAGICDDVRGLCYCDGPGSNSGASGSLKGAHSGRPLSEWCQPATTRDGAPAWGEAVYEDIYGATYGWCSVAVGSEPAVSCGCNIDGQAGKWCEAVTEQVCPNSCSGHGRCDGGFCLCEAGWFGHDCAGRVRGQTPDEPNISKALQDRPWLAGHLVPPLAAAQLQPDATRRRPLIFVYDTPAWAAARMMQYRGAKQSCTWRYFYEGNSTRLNTNWWYAAEFLLHELLLSSPHRTMDPGEADLFYVPAYVACYAWPVLGAADFPWWYSAGGPRVSHMAKILLELKQHIQQTYPYWNRTGGRDHIWLAPHDEGACWFPTEVYQHSIILTHWGRMDVTHTSNTAYAPDNYTWEWVDTAHWGYENVSWTVLIKGHPCYSPEKDLVIPAPKFPPQYRWSPLLGAPPQPRETLLYFRGDVGLNRQPNYSRGIRQRLHELAQTPEWRDKYRIRIGTRDDVPGDYSKGLASSRFCLVAPGDGWSGRAEDAVLHGCIPVIVQDHVHAPLESVLDYDSFSLRVSEQQVDQLPHILSAVTAKQLQQMQHNLQQVWHRFAYLSHPLLMESAEEVRQHWQRQRQQSDQQPSSSGLWTARHKDSSSNFVLTKEHAEDDAFGTILQWLYIRSHQLQRQDRQLKKPAPPEVAAAGSPEGVM